MRKSEFAQILERKMHVFNSTDSVTIPPKPPSHHANTQEFIQIIAFECPYLTRTMGIENYLKSDFASEKIDKNCGQKATLQDQKTNETEKMAPRLYLSLVDGATYIAWLEMRKLGHSEFQQDNITYIEAKKAFRQLAKQFHPDTGIFSDPDQFMSLKTAFDIIEQTFTEVFDI